MVARKIVIANVLISLSPFISITSIGKKSTEQTTFVNMSAKTKQECVYPLLLSVKLKGSGEELYKLHQFTLAHIETNQTSIIKRFTFKTGPEATCKIELIFVCCFQSLELDWYY